jgi:hypothetical protein
MFCSLCGTSLLVSAIGDRAGTTKDNLRIVLKVVAGVLMIFTVGLVAAGLLIQGSPGEPAAAEADEAVATYPSRVCSALPAVDYIEGDALPAYFQLLDLGDAERRDDRHDEIRDDMLGISEQIFRGSADESEFGELELTIGAWMEHLLQAMTAINMAYRTGDNSFEIDASKTFATARSEWTRIESLRAGLIC